MCRDEINADVIRDRGLANGENLIGMNLINSHGDDDSLAISWAMWILNGF